MPARGRRRVEVPSATLLREEGADRLLSVGGTLEFIYAAELERGRGGPEPGIPKVASLVASLDATPGPK